MRRSALKALFTLLTLRRDNEAHVNRDQVILICSGVVTLGLIGLYAYGKATGHW